MGEKLRGKGKREKLCSEMRFKMRQRVNEAERNMKGPNKWQAPAGESQEQPVRNWGIHEEGRYKKQCLKERERQFWSWQREFRKSGRICEVHYVDWCQQLESNIVIRKSECKK